MLNIAQVSRFLLALLSWALLTACQGPTEASGDAATESAELRDVDWFELMPEDDLEELVEKPTVIHDGSFKALQTGSAKTVEGLDGTRVRIPGYIVPIESDADGQLTDFFLVPYFGACIHVPPPPPNQIIYGKTVPAVPMTDIYAAYYVEGILRTKAFEDETAATAYTLDVQRVYLWE